jgi:hypothetical protein
MNKIITAAEMAAHYEPLIDLHGALAKIEEQAAEIEKLRRDHAAAVKEANIAKARLRGVEKQWHADRAALKDWGE